MPVLGTTWRHRFAAHFDVLEPVVGHRLIADVHRSTIQAGRKTNHHSILATLVLASSQGKLSADLIYLVTYASHGAPSVARCLTPNASNHQRG